MAQNAAPSEHPDPRVQAYLDEHANEIRSLQGLVEDASADPAQRMQALQQLAMLSDDAVLPVAARLIHDPSEEIAREAVGLLVNSVIMAGHSDPASGMLPATPHQAGSPWSDYVGEQHDLALEALRDASQDPRAEIALIALKQLVRLSDASAIKSIQQAAENGRLTQSQAVTICSQALSDLGRACLLDYLSEGSAEGQAAAVEALGAIASTQPMVRDKIYLNSNADPLLRSSAADVLGRYDPSFTSYGLTVTTDPTTPPEVFASAIRSYALSAQAAGELGGAQRSVITRAIENKVLEWQADDKLDPQSPTYKSLIGIRDSFAAGEALSYE